MGGRLRVAIAIAAALVLGACTDNGTPAPRTTTPPQPTTTAERFARGEPDGVLTIGVLLPRTGPGATLGEPLIDVIEVAVQSINSSGGVAGRDVEIQTFDEAAPASVDDLLEEESIDAVIGPASSNNALAMLPTITAAGVAACSPTATSIALTDMPDGGLFFRTVPSDALQARALARQIDRTGLGSTSLVYTDDVYGRPFAAAVRNALGALVVVEEVPYSPDDEDFAEEAAQIIAAQPPAVVMIGDAESGGRMVGAILGAGTTRPIIIANDAIRLADFGGSRVDASVVARHVSGVGVRAYEAQDELTPLLQADLAGAAFAAAAVDCVNLLALGAIAAQSPDEPGQIVAKALQLSVGGVPCPSFAVCRQTMDEGRDVDYNGPTGLLALDDTGDVTRAMFDVYGFDDSGNDKSLESIQVGN